MLSKIWKRIYTSVVYWGRRQKDNLGFNIHQLLIAVDQTLNVVCGLLIGSKSYSDETFSSRCWRWKKDNIRSYPANIVDTLLFFDRDKTTGKKHCELSYDSEMNRTQLPPEFRK